MMSTDERQPRSGTHPNKPASFTSSTTSRGSIWRDHSMDANNNNDRRKRSKNRFGKRFVSPRVRKLVRFMNCKKNMPITSTKIVSSDVTATKVAAACGVESAPIGVGEHIHQGIYNRGQIHQRASATPDLTIARSGSSDSGTARLLECARDTWTTQDLSSRASVAESLSQSIHIEDGPAFAEDTQKVDTEEPSLQSTRRSRRHRKRYEETDRVIIGMCIVFDPTAEMIHPQPLGAEHRRSCLKVYQSSDTYGDSLLGMDETQHSSEHEASLLDDLLEETTDLIPNEPLLSWPESHEETISIAEELVHRISRDLDMPWVLDPDRWSHGSGHGGELLLFEDHTSTEHAREEEIEIVFEYEGAHDDYDWDAQTPPPYEWFLPEHKCSPKSSSIKTSPTTSEMSWGIGESSSRSWGAVPGA